MTEFDHYWCFGFTRSPLQPHMWAVDFEFPVAIRASLPSATTCLERPYLLGPLGGRYIQIYCIALKFDRQLGSSAAEASVTFQWSDNSKYKSCGFETLCEILQEDVLWSNIETYMVYLTIMGVIFHLFIICYDWWCHFPFFKKSFCHNQSGTKPNLVAKILATNFGVFFYIYIMFSKICSMWV